MLSVVVAHTGEPPAPHDVWASWSADPVVLVGLVIAASLYWRGLSRGPRDQPGVWRARAFAGGLAAVFVAVSSPLDAASSALASAHMVQHVLLLLVAAPLLALSAPGTTLLLGSPAAARHGSHRWRRRLRLTRRNVGALRHPAVTGLLHVAVLWTWHAAGPYDAAVGDEALHALEHATFLGTGLLFWQSVLGARTQRVPRGLGILLVFAMGLQSVFLSLLLTFARTPWYESYRSSTAAWGLDRLADQQLAGVIMWVPAGFIYVGTALALLVALLAETERSATARGAGLATR